jgi:hypothetical protein
VTLHFEECFDLRERKVLPIALCHQFIECAQQLEGIAQDLPLVQTLADASGHLSKQVKTVDIL